MRLYPKAYSLKMLIVSITKEKQFILQFYMGFSYDNHCEWSSVRRFFIPISDTSLSITIQVHSFEFASKDSLPRPLCKENKRILLLLLLRALVVMTPILTSCVQIGSRTNIFYCSKQLCTLYQ